MPRYKVKRTRFSWSKKRETLALKYMAKIYFEAGMFQKQATERFKKTIPAALYKELVGNTKHSSWWQRGTHELHSGRPVNEEIYKIAEALCAATAPVTRAEFFRLFNPGEGSVTDSWTRIVTLVPTSACMSVVENLRSAGAKNIQIEER